MSPESATAWPAPLWGEARHRATTWKRPLGNSFYGRSAPSALGSKVLFTDQSSQLWVSDGTSLGTAVIQDFYGACDSTPGPAREARGRRLPMMALLMGLRTVAALPPRPREPAPASLSARV